MAGNPFTYGTVVSDSEFTGRKSEIKTLRQELSAGKSIVLFSERRLGKTSLLKEFMKRCKRDTIPIYIDMYGMTNKERLASAILTGVIEGCYSNLDKIKSAIKDHFSRLRPKIIIDADGKISIDISSDRNMDKEELEEVLDLPEIVARKKRVRIIMIFDEFQELSIMDGVELEKLMRARFQHHKNVSYVFSGSSSTMLRQIFEERSRAFYKFSRPMELGCIPDEEFSPFIMAKFKATGGKISLEFTKKILEYTDGHPYNTQYLCHEIWFLTRKPRWGSVIDSAVDNIITQQNAGFEHMWDQIRSRNQRALLIGCAKEGKFRYSSGFIKMYKLVSQSHVEKAINGLKTKRILDADGNFIDLFFKEWMLRRICK